MLHLAFFCIVCICREIWGGNTPGSVFPGHSKCVCTISDCNSQIQKTVDPTCCSRTTNARRSDVLSNRVEKTLEVMHPDHEAHKYCPPVQSHMQNATPHGIHLFTLRSSESSTISVRISRSKRGLRLRTLQGGVPLNTRGPSRIARGQAWDCSAVLPLPQERKNE